MNFKELRKEAGREMRRIYKLPKREKTTRANKMYLRVLRITYDMLGIGYKEMKIMHSAPHNKYLDPLKESRIHLQGIVDWCEFLLTIQPEEKRSRKEVEATFGKAEK